MTASDRGAGGLDKVWAWQRVARRQWQEEGEEEEEEEGGEEQEEEERREGREEQPGHRCRRSQAHQAGF